MASELEEVENVIGVDIATTMYSLPKQMCIDGDILVDCNGKSVVKLIYPIKGPYAKYMKYIIHTDNGSDIKIHRLDEYNNTISESLSIPNIPVDLERFIIGEHIACYTKNGWLCQHMIIDRLKDLAYKIRQAIMFKLENNRPGHIIEFKW